MDAPKLYRSKIDGWLLIVLVTAMAASGFGALQAISVGAPAGVWMAAAIAVIGVGLPLWILVATHYRFEARDLIVRSGPFRWRIRISEIAEVVPTSNPISSPALSLDRLKITFGAGRTLLVSPCDKEVFRREIERRRLAP